MRLNPIGEMYSPNSTTNGMRTRKSRHLTLSAAIRNPAQMAAANAMKMNIDSVKML